MAADDERVTIEPVRQGRLVTAAAPEGRGPARGWIVRGTGWRWWPTSVTLPSGLETWDDHKDGGRALFKRPDVSLSASVQD